MEKPREALQSSVFALVIAGIVGINAIAQETKQEESSSSVRRVEGASANAPTLPIITPTLPFGRVFDMETMDFRPSGTVKNAPFSAEMIFESIYMSKDGNQTINRSSTLMFRDSQGRTRSEHSFKLFVQTGGANIEHKIIGISDPVSGVGYKLESQTRIAHQFTIVQPANSPNVASALKARPLKADGSGVPLDKIDIACGLSSYMPLGASCISESLGKHESLGKRMIEGMEAEGIRITHTIPAGERGNERPIEIFHERWYSQELQMYVMTKWFDPGAGETTHRLTNLNRSEPDASLFRPPPDY
ncbi:MAG TPA: hypothetical protein VI479_16505, partial [Blastocatellia bacterium]